MGARKLGWEKSLQQQIHDSNEAVRVHKHGKIGQETARELGFDVDRAWRRFQQWSYQRSNCGSPLINTSWIGVETSFATYMRRLHSAGHRP